MPNKFRTVLDGWLHDVKAAKYPDNIFRICKLAKVGTSPVISDMSPFVFIPQRIPM